jgi:histidine triad (HIT) family protein
MIVPKEHIAHWPTRTRGMKCCLGRILAAGAGAGEGTGLHEGFRTIINTGQGWRPGSHALHVHIIGGGKQRAM